MKRKILIVGAFALCVLAGRLSVAWGEDLSRLGGYAATNHSEEIGIHFIVTDSLGRRLGNNGTRAKEDPLREIPGSGYGIESIGDDETGNPGPESIHYGISPVSAGTYTITLYGLATTQFNLYIGGEDISGKSQPNEQSLDGFIAAGTTAQYVLSYDPSPGKGITQFVKQVSFSTLRQDLQTFSTLGLIGDDKFVGSLTRMISSGERQISVCAKNKKNQSKPCNPAIAVLNMFVKRLEAANRKCDSKKPQLCDEDNDWNNFNKEHRNDHDYDDFYHDWDKDDWQKDKKKCKRFVSDEALKIITEDAQWLIKSLGGDIDKNGKEDKDQKGGGRN